MTFKKSAFASVTPNVTTSKIAKSEFDVVTTNNSEFDLDNSDGKESSIKDIQEAYQIMWKTGSRFAR